MKQTAMALGLGVVVLGGLIWALRPQPVPVDLVALRQGPMEVTVEAEGMTRIRSRFAVTTPLTGIALRSPVAVGDQVEKGKTVVAVIQPAEPAFLDARARRQAEAAVTEAEAAVALAEVNLARSTAALHFAQEALDRTLALADRGIVAPRVVEETEAQHMTAKMAADAAQSELTLQRATLARMQAQLVGPESPDTADGGQACCLEIRAPQSGTVLEVTDQSARMVQAGSPLLQIGDLADLEAEVDLLSSDAVQVLPGATAHIDRWGGAAVIDARVRQVEPAGFTRVSALGIEEQRVRARLDLLTPPAARPGLGDRYRVYARIVIWSGADVLQVPQSALFRQGADWAVFRQEAGRAVLVPVTIGHRNGDMAEVLAGLGPKDRLVAFPGTEISDGTAITARAAP